LHSPQGGLALLGKQVHARIIRIMPIMRSPASQVISAKTAATINVAPP